MDKLIIIELRQKIVSLESKEKLQSQVIKTRRRNKTIGIVMVIGGVLFSIIFNETLHGNETLPPLFCLAAIAGAIIWYKSNKLLKPLLTEYTALCSEIESIKNELIKEEYS